MGPNFGTTWTDENCYAYALNLTGTRKDPGSGIFIENGQVNPAKLKTAIVADGAEEVSSPIEPAVGSQPGKHLIAFKCDSRGINYHVIRRDESSGIWYSKTPLTMPGQYQAAQNFNPWQSDWNPQIILTLQGLLSVWIGYYWVKD
jgi:hypothetical protein